MGDETTWADVAHLYSESGIELEVGVGFRPFRGVNTWPSKVGKRALFLDASGHHVRSTEYGIAEYKPVLGHLEDMTEAHAREFIQIFLASDQHDPIEDSELSFDIHRWDNALMLDGDIAIHFDIGTRCWEGELMILQDGGIESRDCETGEIYRVTNQMKLILYLLNKGYDLFGLIESGQALRREAQNG